MKLKGFSLIELIVVVAIMGGLAVATSRIFFANLRGTEKTQRLIDLRQAGDQAMLTMKRKIRLAREVTSSCPAGGASDSSIVITRRDPQATGFASTATITTSISCDTVDQRLRIYETDTDTGAVLIDSYITPEYLMIDSCSAVFTCEKTIGIPARVTIEYMLQNSNGDSMDFSSTVSLRNF